MMYNSLFSVGVTFIAGVLTGDFRTAMTFEITPGFVGALGALIVVSLMLNFSTVLSVTVTTPLSTAITG
jgi:hypothetical protein